MSKILVLGYLGLRTNQLDGQTVKTRDLYKLASQEFDDVDLYDTEDFKFKKLSIFKMFWKVITPLTPKLKSMPWNVTGVSLSIMSSPPACQLMTSSADAISTLSPLSFTGSSASCVTVDVSLNGLYSAFLSKSVPCAALYSSVACANSLLRVGSITFVPSFVPIWYGWRIALLFSKSNICFCNERACL